MHEDKRWRRPHLHTLRFFADWYDEKGKRCVKGFLTKAAALKHERLMKAQARRKKAHASKRLVKSSRRGPTTNHHATKTSRPISTPHSAASPHNKSTSTPSSS